MNHSKTAISEKDVPVNQAHIKLACQAADGEPDSRAQVNRLAHEIIAYQTNRFCRRFCRDNRYRYICTLVDQTVKPPRDAVFCEWGNASYTWMLEDLTSPGRLRQYSGTNGARLNDYFYFIANSLPFYERWKDWRFGRKVHVPTYIKELFPEAGKIFYALRSGDNIAEIAQKIFRSEQDTENMCHQIIVTLTQRKRLHLLDPPNTVSMSQSGHSSDKDDSATELDIPYYDEAPEITENKQKLSAAWVKLTPVEQYVIEAMVIDNIDATDVLLALQTMQVSVKDGVAANDTNRQQLYYFRRKTLAKLAEFMQ